MGVAARRRLQCRYATIALALLSACGSSTDDGRPAGALDKAGNPEGSGPITLTVAWYGGEGRPQAQVVERFADEVARASDGELTIDVHYGMPDAWQQFRSGGFDLLLSPTRSFDTIGVTTFDALSLPFLVADDGQADRVAQSSIVDEMMAGLSEIDATGLMFDPVYEIHLGIAGDEPLTSLDQLQPGLRVSPPGDRIDAIYAALGTHAVHGLDGTEWEQAIADGDVTAYEFPVSLAAPAQSRMAANFALYYEFVVLLASDASLERLDPRQLEIVKESAAIAEQRSIDERVREDSSFRDACQLGASLTVAPTTLITDIREATDAAVADALSDAETMRFYLGIKEAAGDAAPARSDECDVGVVTTHPG